MPRRRLTTTDSDPTATETPKLRPGPARLWLSPAGYLVVEFPYDAPSVDAIKALPSTDRKWLAAERAWLVTVQHVDDVRRIFASRFAVVDEHPDVAAFVDRRARASRHATVARVVGEAAKSEGAATVYDLAAFRREGGAGGAA